MRVDEHTFQIETGHRIHHYVHRPDGPPVGGVLMIHGLGDYLGRYGHLAEFFVRHGLMTAGVDLPGHGRSSGQRGHIPGFEVIRDLLDRDLSVLQKEAGGLAKMGIFAHSMGGFAAFDYLPRRREAFDFAWLSSPLVSPSANQKPIIIKLARTLGRFVPRLPFDTGVRAALCRPPDPKTGQFERDPFLHHAVSAGFGSELILREQEVKDGVKGIDPELKLLVTHGAADKICPAQRAEELFAALPCRQKRFVLIEGGLHEPLHGDHREWVRQKASEWLTEIGLPLMEGKMANDFDPRRRTVAKLLES